MDVSLSSKRSAQSSSNLRTIGFNTELGGSIPSPLANPLGAIAPLLGRSSDSINNQLAGTSNSPIVVDSTADTLDANDGKTTLREGILQANQTLGNDQIQFELGAGVHTITLINGQLQITDRVRINGLGANNLTINGNSNQVFAINPDVTMEMDAFAIANGSSDRGGGIYNQGTLTLTHMHLHKNSAIDGGGIFNEGNLTLIQSRLSENSATQGGGLLNDFTATIVNSTLDSNFASAGGGILNQKMLTVTNSTLSGNSTNTDGGGILNRGTLTSVSNTITLNIADNDQDGSGGGGGIYNTTEGSTTSINTIIAANLDRSDPSKGSNQPDVRGYFSSQGYNLIGNQASSVGFGGTGDLLDVAPKLGTLQSYDGVTLIHALLPTSPAVDAGGVSPADSFDLNGNGNVIESFPYDQRGVGFSRVLNGRIDMGAVESTPLMNLTVDNLEDELDDNFAPGDLSLREALAVILPGGNITFAATMQGTLTLTMGELVVNRNMSIAGLDPTVLTLSADHGSRIFSITNNATVNLSKLTLADGFTTGSGGAIANAIGSTLTLDDMVLKNNQAEQGGAIANFGTLTVTGSLITDNIATNRGGGIYSDGKRLTIQNSTLWTNAATLGGGLFNINQSAIDSSTFFGNTATFSGGGIYNGAALPIVPPTPPRLTLSNVTLSNNYAKGEGGGLHNSGILTALNTTIAFNQATNGGGIRNFASANLKNTIVANNTATNQNPDIFGSFNSQGFNLIRDGSGSNDLISQLKGDIVGTRTNPIDPKLKPLYDNGGYMFTHALFSDSPAINAADPWTSLPIDQIGQSRRQGDRADIGAVEWIQEIDTVS
jgi:predicted outer membrane repeat protein